MLIYRLAPCCSLAFGCSNPLQHNGGKRLARLRVKPGDVAELLREEIPRGQDDTWPERISWAGALLERSPRALRPGRRASLGSGQHGRKVFC